MKFVETAVVLSEIPECVSLAINISNCPNNCPGCHSVYLKENIGETLTRDNLLTLINKNKGINCVLFMGGDSNPNEVFYWASFVKKVFPNIKTAWYSGCDYIYDELNAWKYLDYIKFGSYNSSLGSLRSKTTNQRLYKRLSGNIIDITYKFQYRSK